MSIAAAPGKPEQSRRSSVPFAAPEEQRGEVAALLEVLTAIDAQRTEGALPCRLVGPSGHSIPIPESVFYALERVAEVLARGDSITLVPVGKELTTQQAANLLNVSRQYLVRLVDAGRIPHTKTGRHRRLRVEDVLDFKEQRDREREARLDELTALSQEVGGYGELE